MAKAKAKPYEPGATYPTTEVLKAMTDEEYARHWARICATIRAADYTYSETVYYPEED